MSAERLQRGLPERAALVISVGTDIGPALHIPLGRLGDSRTDIGAAVVAMCSDHWRYVTGLTIPVDGGNYSAQ